MYVIYTCDTFDSFSLQQVFDGVDHCKLIENFASVLECETSLVATLRSFICHLPQLMDMVMSTDLKVICIVCILKTKITKLKTQLIFYLL